MGRLTRLHVALLFGVYGIACMAVLVGAQTDRPSLSWPLLALPGVAVAAMLTPSRNVRLAAAAAMCAWCVLAAASVGMFLLPAAVAMIWAARGTP